MVFGDLSPGALNAIVIDRSGTAVSDGLGQHHLCDRQRVEVSSPAQSWLHDSTGRGGRQPKPHPATQSKEHPGHPGGGCWVGDRPCIPHTLFFFVFVFFFFFLFVFVFVFVLAFFGFQITHWVYFVIFVHLFSTSVGGNGRKAAAGARSGM
jgi:hypothetical protein